MHKKLLFYVLVFGFIINCQKNQKQTTFLQNQSTISVAAQGHLVFSDAQILEQTLQNGHATAFAKMQKNTEFPWLEQFPHLQNVFDEKGILQVGDVLFHLEKEGISQSNLEGKNKILVKSLEDLLEETSSYALTPCKNQSPKNTLSPSYPTLLKDKISDVEDFLEDHHADEVFAQIQNHKKDLEDLLQNPELTAYEKKYLEDLLRLPAINTQIDQFKTQEKLFASSGEKRYYIDNFLKQNHPDFVHFDARSIQKPRDPLLIGGVVVGVLMNIFGGGNNKDEIKAIQGTLDKLSQSLNQLTAVVNGLQETVKLWSTQKKQLWPLGQHAFWGGINAWMTQFLIQNLSVPSVELEKIIGSLGIFLDQDSTKIGFQIDRSFVQDFQLMMEDQNQKYFHLYYAYKDVNPELGKTNIYFQRYSIATDKNFEKIQPIRASFHDSMSSKLEGNYQNEFGFAYALTQKTFKNAQDHPAVETFLPHRKGICVQDLSLEHVTQNNRISVKNAYQGKIQVIH